MSILTFPQFIMFPEAKPEKMQIIGELTVQNQRNRKKSQLLKIFSRFHHIIGNNFSIFFHLSIFFPSLKTNWIFLPVQTGFFPSFWVRVKYFDGRLLNYLFLFYNSQRYTLPDLVWWIHYSHCCESKKWKPGKFHLCSLWNDIFNYPNWDFGFW